MKMQNRHAKINHLAWQTLSRLSEHNP